MTDFRRYTNGAFPLVAFIKSRTSLQSSGSVDISNSSMDESSTQILATSSNKDFNFYNRDWPFTNLYDNWSQYQNSIDYIGYTHYTGTSLTQQTRGTADIRLEDQIRDDIDAGTSHGAISKGVQNNKLVAGRSMGDGFLIRYDSIMKSTFVYSYHNRPILDKYGHTTGVIGEKAASRTQPVLHFNKSGSDETDWFCNGTPLVNKLSVSGNHYNIPSNAIIDFKTMTSYVTNMVPEGSIIMLAGGSPIPSGWAICDGAIVNTVNYNADGTVIRYTTPNLVGKFIRGATSSGGTGGYDSIQSHTHSTVGGAAMAAGEEGGVGVISSVDSSVTSGNGSNLPPYYELIFIVKLPYLASLK